MKAGMFGREGRIELWVNSSGWVINGAWQVLYWSKTDEVSEPNASKPKLRYQRLSNVIPALMKGDYNTVIYQHQKRLDDKRRVKNV